MKRTEVFALAGVVLGGVYACIALAILVLAIAHAVWGLPRPASIPASKSVSALMVVGHGTHAGDTDLGVHTQLRMERIE